MMHSILPGDTSLEAARIQYEIWTRLSPAERARRTFQLSDDLRNWGAAGVRQRHPEYSDEQVRLAVLRLAIGEKLFRTAFPNLEILP